MKINQENLKNLSKKSLFQYQKLFPVLTKEKNRQYGMLGLTFITLTIFGVFAINPTLTTIVELQKKAADARFVDDRLTQKITNLQTLRQQYTSLESDLVFVERAIPKSPLPVRFIGQVQAISNLSSVQLTALQIDSITLTSTNKSDSPSPEEMTSVDPTLVTESSDNSQTGTYRFTLGVNGTYSQVHEFLTTLTEFDRLTTVDTVSISRASTETPLVFLEIAGTTYYQP